MRLELMQELLYSGRYSWKAQSFGYSCDTIAIVPLSGRPFGLCASRETANGKLLTNIPWTHCVGHASCSCVGSTVRLVGMGKLRILYIRH